MRSRKDSPSAPALWAEVVFDILGAMPAARAADELRLDIQACHPDSHAAAVAEAFAAGLDPEIGFELARVLRLEHGDDPDTQSFSRLAHLIRALCGSQQGAIETGLAILRLDADAVKALGLEVSRDAQVRTAVGWILLGVRDLGSDSFVCSENWPAVARDLGSDFVKPLSDGRTLIVRRALIERIRNEGFDKVAADVGAECRKVATTSAADTARANRERAEHALAGTLHDGADEDEFWIHAALADKPLALAYLVKALADLVRRLCPGTPAAVHADAALRAFIAFGNLQQRHGNTCALVLALLAEVATYDAGPTYAIESLAILIAARLGDRSAAASLARYIRSAADHVKDEDVLRDRMSRVAEAWRILGTDPEAALAEETDLGVAALRIAGETRKAEPDSSSALASDDLWLHAALASHPPALADLIKAFAGFVRESFPDSDSVQHADAALRTVTFFVRGGDVRGHVSAAIDGLDGKRLQIPERIRMLGVLISARLGDAKSASELARDLVRISRHIGTKDTDEQALRRRLHLVAHGWMVLSADQSAADLGTHDYGQAALENGYGVMSMFEEHALDRMGAARRRTAERKVIEPETLVVLKAVAAAPKNHGRTSHTSSNDYGDFDGLILRPLPLVRAPDLTASRAELAAEFPHAAGLIENILGDLIGRRSIRLRPTLLLGPPGGGKSRLARRLCEALSLPHLLYPAAGIGDASFAGTARRWSSAEPSLPLRLLRDRDVANPALIMDELEKAGSSARNGRLWDALIPMLEKETASCWEDPYVQSPVDLSAVNWLATANSLDGLPGPLLDRLRILRMPSPTAEHLPVLAASLMRELARERGLDERWLQPLAGYELEGLQGAWKSGSVRGLRRLLEGVLEARDMSALRN